MTRLYLRAATTASAPTDGEKSTALPVGTFKGNSGTGFENLSLSTAKGASQTTKALAGLAQTGHQDNYMARFTSRPLAGNITAQTWTLAVCVSQGHSTRANRFLFVSAYVWRPSNSSVVGYVYDSHTALGTEWGSSEAARVVTFSGGAVTVTAGDVLVVEVWNGAEPDQGTYSVAYTETLYFDGTTDVIAGTTSNAASYLETPQTLSFQTFAPNIPVSNTATNITANSFSANWTAAVVDETHDAATKYYLDVATNSGFTSYVDGFQNLDVGNVVTYPVTGLTAGTPYWYRVRAYNPTGTSSSSSAQNPTTATPPNAPNIAASTLHTTSSFQANWAAPTGGATPTGYRLDVSTDVNFGVGNYVTGYQDLDVGNVLLRSVTGLSAGGTYYYRVRAYNAAGAGSNSSTQTAWSTLTASDGSTTDTYNFESGFATLHGSTLGAACLTATSPIAGSYSASAPHLVADVDSGLHILPKPSATYLKVTWKMRIDSIGSSTPYIAFLKGASYSAAELYWDQADNRLNIYYHDTTHTYQRWTGTTQYTVGNTYTFALEYIPASGQVKLWVDTTLVATITTVCTDAAVNQIDLGVYASSDTTQRATLDDIEIRYSEVLTPIEGTGSATFGSMTSSGASKVADLATGAATLGVLTGSGAGKVADLASGTLTLGNMSAQGAGGVVVGGSGSVELDVLLGSGAAGLSIGGSGTATLGALLASGGGTISAAPPPDAPSAAASTLHTTSSFQANWTAPTSGPTPTGYRLDVSTDPEFGSYVTGYEDLDVGDALLASVSALGDGGTYYYRVRAYNAVGSGDSSGVQEAWTTLGASDGTAPDVYDFEGGLDTLHGYTTGSVCITESSPLSGTRSVSAPHPVADVDSQLILLPHAGDYTKLSWSMRLDSLGAGDYILDVRGVASGKWVVQVSYSASDERLYVYWKDSTYTTQQAQVAEAEGYFAVGGTYACVLEYDGVAGYIKFWADDTLMLDAPSAVQGALIDQIKMGTASGGTTARVTYDQVSVEYEPPLSSIEGTGAVTLGALSTQGAGGVGLGGAGDITFDDISSTAVSTLLISGAASSTLGAMTGSGAGKAANLGSGSVSLGSLYTTGAGTLELAGSGSAILGAMSGSAAAYVRTNGAGSSQLGVMTGSGAASLKLSGSGSEQLSPLDTQGAGSLRIAGQGGALFAPIGRAAAARLGIAGWGAVTFDALTAQGAGQLGGAAGSGAVTLNPLTAQGAGKVRIYASGSAQLGAASSTGAGKVRIDGASRTPLSLDALLSAAAATLRIAGSGAAALDALTSVGEGRALSGIGGEGAVTLGPLTASGGGTLRLDGAASAAFGSLTSTGAGSLPLAGSGAATLGAMTGAGAGGVRIAAQSSTTFGAMSTTGASTVQTVQRSGSGAVQLGAMHTAGAGALRIAGAGSATFAPLGRAAAARLGISGQGSATLGAMVSAGSATIQTVQRAGTGSIRFEALTSSGAASLRIEGAGAATLGRVTGLSAAALLIEAQGAATLAPMTGDGFSVFGGLPPQPGHLYSVSGALPGSYTVEGGLAPSYQIIGSVPTPYVLVGSIEEDT